MSKKRTITLDLSETEKYDIFAVCQDFRQRIKELNRLKEELINKPNLAK